MVAKKTAASPSPTQKRGLEAQAKVAANLAAAKPDRASRAVKPDPEAKAVMGVRKGAAFKAPKTLGAAADEYYELREERLGLTREADGIRAHETFVKEYLIASLPKSDAGGVAGRLARVAVTTKQVPQVSDWPRLYKYIVDEYLRHVKAKDGQQDAAFAFLNRALNDGAVKEVWGAKKQVPGVGSFTAVSLSLCKI